MTNIHPLGTSEYRRTGSPGPLLRLLLLTLVVNAIGCGDSERPKVVLAKFSDPIPANQQAGASSETDDAEVEETAAAKISDEPLKIEEIVQGIPEGRIYRTAKIRLAEENFDELEKLFAFLREKRPISPHGNIVLETAYQMVSNPEQADEKLWKERFEVLERWQQAKPESVTPLVAMGHAYICYAWQARGSGFAHTVGEENFRLFHERIAKAREILAAGAELEDRDAAVYAYAAAVAKAESWPRERVDALVDRSIEIDPKYFTTYVAVAELLLPRWGGGPGELEKFALDIADRLEGDDGLDAYLRIVAQVHMYGEDVFNMFDIEKLKAAIPVIEKRYPENGLLIQFACLVACHTKDHATAHKLFSMIPDEGFAPRVWRNKPLFERYKKWSNPQLVRGKEKLIIQAHPFQAMSVAYSPEGKLLITTGTGDATSDDSVKLWNAQDGTFLSNLPGIEHGRRAQFSADGRYLAASGFKENSGYVVVWSLQDRQTRELHDHPSGLAAVALSDDSKWIATSGNAGQLRIWDLATGEKHLELPLTLHCKALLFMDDNKSLMGLVAGARKKWSIETGEEIPMPDAGDERIDADATVELADGTQLFLGVRAAADRTPATLNAETGELFNLLPPNQPYPGIPKTMTPHGKHVFFSSTTSLPNVALFELANRSVVHLFQGHSGNIHDLDISPDKKTLATAADDGTVRLWDLEAALAKPETPAGPPEQPAAIP